VTRKPVIDIPDPGYALTCAWHLLFDLAEELPDTWCLIGGMMVALHGLEHGKTEVRATADGDVLADVRAAPGALRQITEFLEAHALEPEPGPGETLHRFRRPAGQGDIIVDVLAPDHMGSRADLTTRPPGRTVEVPGGTQALDRSARVRVRVAGRTGYIPRPSLTGAILVKAAALSLSGDPDRHYQDLAFLLTLVEDPLTARSELTQSERRRLRDCPLLDKDCRGWRWLHDDDRRNAYAALTLMTSTS
jgi:hypothetical protein